MRLPRLLPLHTHTDSVLSTRDTPNVFSLTPINAVLTPVHVDI
jgi:hypothetical protein